MLPIINRTINQHQPVHRLFLVFLALSLYNLALNQLVHEAHQLPRLLIALQFLSTLLIKVAADVLVAGCQIPRNEGRVVAELPMHDKILQDVFPCLLVLGLGNQACGLVEGLSNRVIFFYYSVNVFLERGHLADYILNDLRRQLFQDLIFGPS
jgi:hypothetical protein